MRWLLRLIAMGAAGAVVVLGVFLVANGLFDSTAREATERAIAFGAGVVAVASAGFVLAGLRRGRRMWGWAGLIGMVAVTAATPTQLEWIPVVVAMGALPGVATIREGVEATVWPERVLEGKWERHAKHHGGR